MATRRSLSAPTSKEDLGRSPDYRLTVNYKGIMTATAGTLPRNCHTNPMCQQLGQPAYALAQGA